MFVFSIYSYYSDIDLTKDTSKDNENIQEESEDLGSTDSSSTSDSGTSSVNSSGSGGGSGGSGGGGGSSLLDDLNTSPCGLYYQEYNVCAGVCDEGTCVSEGRSCFCRIS